jgi:hypothetical protein
MHRSISTLFTAVLFSAAMMPDAMAQMQSRSPENLSNNSANTFEQPASDSANLSVPGTGALPEPTQNSASTGNTGNTAKSPGIAYPRMSYSHLTYCSIPPRAEPGDWDYREAMYICLHGID